MALPQGSPQSEPAHPAATLALTLPIRVPPSKQTAICPECGTEVKRKVLQRHIDTQHTKQKDFGCVQCFKTFHRKDHLLRHLRETHEETSEPVECVYCSKEIRRRYLKEHWKGQKCTNAQKPRSDTLQRMDSEAMVDPRIISTLLFWIVYITAKKISDAGPIVQTSESIPWELLSEIWILRDYVVRQTRKRVINALHSNGRVCQDVWLKSHVLVLATVDMFLFGLDSVELDAHLKCFSSVIWHPPRIDGFLLEYEQIWEHAIKMLVDDEDTMVINLAPTRAGIFGRFLISRRLDMPQEGKYIEQIYIPRSLKCGQYLVDTPIYRGAREYYFVYRD